MSDKYPAKGIRKPKFGINLTDNKFEVAPTEAFTLRNSIYVRDTVLQRGGFAAFSTTNFSAFGRFRGAHDYQAPGADARLLFLTNTGIIKEYLTASTESDRVTGLTNGLEGYFATVYDAVVFANGTDTQRIGRGTSWRAFGSPAAVSTLAVSTTGAAGIAAGTYLHVVVPVIDVSGVAKVFADWSNVVKTTIGAAVTQFNLTWTDVVDSRVTRYLIFRTEAGATDLRSIGVVNAGVGAFTDNFADSSLPVTVSGGPGRPAPRYSWGVPPVAKLVAFSGERCFLGNIATGSLQNALVASRKAGDAYEAEGFPDTASDSSTLVRLPGAGDLTAMVPMGNIGGGRAGDLFISLPSACYILPESDPDLPLQDISQFIGCIGQRAFAKDGSWLFFQSRRGVEFWPGAGKDIFLLSDKVQPIFDGGGNQSLTANQSDDDIRYEIFDNTLWITVRDSASVTGPNKVYCMDLNFFRKSFDPANPSSAARFTGPLDNTGLGFGLLLKRIGGTLINFDNQNSRILNYSKSAGQDTIAGVATNIPLRWTLGPILKESPNFQKTLTGGHVYVFTNTALTLTIYGEFENVVTEATVEPNSTSFLWDDITWDDITWLYDTWYQDLIFEFSIPSAKWFYPKFEKSDSNGGCAFFGDEYYFNAMEIIRNFP